jgi:hypothetical protein
VCSATRQRGRGKYRIPVHDRLESCEPLRFDQDDQDVSAPEIVYLLESKALMKSTGRIGR